MRLLYPVVVLGLVMAWDGRATAAPERPAAPAPAGSAGPPPGTPPASEIARCRSLPIGPEKARCTEAQLARCKAIKVRRDQAVCAELVQFGARAGEACAAGDAAACAQAAYNARWGSFEPKDVTRAIELGEQACQGKQARGCEIAASLLRYGGDGIKADRARAQRLYGTACELEPSFTACNAAAEIALGGKRPDGKTAVTYFERLCDKPDAAGCTRAAMYHEKGSFGLKVDKAKAKALRAKAAAAPKPSDDDWGF